MTLIGATVASVWGDIFHHPDDETVLDDTLACVRWMHSEWDGLPENAPQNLPLEWDAVSQRSHKRKLHPTPDMDSGTRFPDAKRPHNVAFDLYMFSGYPYDKPRSNNGASVRAEAYKVHREFRTQRRPLNVASVLRRTV